MDKNVLKKYAVWARRELIVRVGQRATFYGVTEEDYGDVSADSINGRILSDVEKKQRKALIAQIRKKSYVEVIEEVAYTWFNRFLALRFMEVNGYLPDRVKIFTDSDNCFQPQILNEAIDLEIVGLDMGKVYAYKDANQTEELYKYLLVVQCNALNAVLPGMFQKIEDYTELLLPDKLLLEGSVIERMIALIPEEDWKDAAQIIGWMYQYYNSEKKDEVFAALKENVKITKENIPAATQLFTPDWIVRYMVENSLGRLWVEGHPNEELKANWKYYLEEAEQEPEVEAELVKIRVEYAQLTPEDIRCIDPCQGSGHILVYMFDVLMQIYESYGYTTQEAVASIVKNNIYGLDIDERAAQLSYFAVMMKACQYDKRFLKRKDEDGKPKVPQPRVYAIQESNDVDSHVLEYFCNGNVELKEAMETVMEEMHDAKEYGSIITITEQNWDVIYARFEEIEEDISIYKDGALELLPLVKEAQALAQKYDIVCTNPPYMNGSGMGSKLLKYVQSNFKNEKTDAYACFISKSLNMIHKYRYVALITMETWMFIASMAKMRNITLDNSTIINLVHMPYLGKGGTSLGINFGTAAFVLLRGNISPYFAEYNYLRYYECDNEGIPNGFPVKNERQCRTDQNIYKCIPGCPIAYWVSNELGAAFKHPKISEKSISDGQIKTGNNEKYLRFIWEVSVNRIGKEQKWVFIAKGGSFRRWYGNIEYVIDWSETARIHYRKDHVARISPEYIWFREGVSWNHVTSIERFAARYLPDNMLFETAAPSIFFKDHETLLWVIGYLNTYVSEKILKLINPTMCTNVGDITMQPLILGDDARKIKVVSLVKCAIELSKKDWDSFEVSCDFQRHPLIVLRTKSKEKINNGKWQYRIEDAFFWWNNECEARFIELRSNEEELNSIFINIYGLQNELTPVVEDKDVTVRKADLQRDIRSLISYAVGCMFGRYSLDKEGLIFAGGRMEDKFSYYGGTFADTQDYQFDGKYTFRELGSKFYYIPVEGKKALECWKVDADNIIPISDDEYFEDDIVEKFVQFIRTVYGEEFLDTNLKFIADALGGKGQPREVIRNYFLNDFYKDHCKIYQKRPIYWLFDSGKKNGFKCLIYMHRYEPDTIARIRTDYVHEQQSRYRTAIEDLEHRIANAGTSERVKLNKSLKKIQEQADELHTYEEKIHHLADQMIAIDLDDGVKHNYEIFKDVLAKIK